MSRWPDILPFLSSRCLYQGVRLSSDVPGTFENLNTLCISCFASLRSFLRKTNQPRITTTKKKQKTKTKNKKKTKKKDFNRIGNKSDQLVQPNNCWFLSTPWLYLVDAVYGTYIHVVQHNVMVVFPYYMYSLIQLLSHIRIQEHFLWLRHGCQMSLLSA